MKGTYAVVWSENAHSLAGKLVLDSSGLRLEGAGGSCELPFSEIAQVHVGRSAAERLDGRPVVVIERRGREPLRIATVGEVGALLELADGIADLKPTAATGRLVVVAPLRRNVRERVRELLAEGPPFDPQALGLTAHEVFLTDREAIFVFDAGPGRRLGDRLLLEPALWKAAARWRACLAGLPRVAEAAWAWPG